MNMTVTIKPKKTAYGSRRKYVVEIDADKLERVAAAFGMFNPEFLKSVERAERDYAAGRIYEVRSLEELRKAQGKRRRRSL